MLIGSRAWHDRRALSGASSDTSTLLGCSPFAGRSPLALAWQKRGIIDSAVDTDSEMRLVWDELEAIGRKWLAHSLQCTVDKVPDRDDFVTRCTDCGVLCNSPRFEPQDTETNNILECCDACSNGTAVHLHANLDGRVLYDGRELGYEGKSITWNNPDYAGWKRDGVPKAVAWQVQHALWCTGLPAALIVVFDMTHAKFSTRVVEANASKQAFLVDAWRTWWQAAVIDEIDPAHDWSDSVAAAIKQRWPDVTDEERTLDDDESAIVEVWADSKNNALMYAKMAKQRRAQVAKLMKGAARITTTSGAHVIRSKSTHTNKATGKTTERITLRHYEGTTI